MRAEVRESIYIETRGGEVAREGGSTVQFAIRLAISSGDNRGQSDKAVTSGIGGQTGGRALDGSAARPALDPPTNKRHKPRPRDTQSSFQIKLPKLIHI